MRMDQAQNVQPDVQSENRGRVNREHDEAALLDILKLKEIHPLDAFAKRIYGTKIEEAIVKDVAGNVERRLGENAVRLAALSSIAVLRAVGVMKTQASE